MPVPHDDKSSKQESPAERRKRKLAAVQRGQRRTSRSLLSMGLLILLVGALFLIFADHCSSLLVWFLRASLPGLLVMTAAVLVFFWLAAARVSSAASLGIAGLVMIAGLAWVSFVLPYQRASVYHESAVLTDVAMPGVTPRAPFVVASAQARPNLGDATGEIAGTTYLPDRDAFATLVNQRGTLAGYSTVLEQKVPLTGRGEGRRCDFAPEASDRIGGLWGHKLERAVHSQRRGVKLRLADAYAYCEADGRPIVVAPLTRQVGWINVTEAPAGVAVYDGRTGDVRIVTDAAELAAVPGPTYPLSLAEKQREALKASGGWWNWLMQRSGFESTADQKDDPNSDNPTEFTVQIASATGPAPAYVTPLTGRGSATSIAAVGVLPARLDGTSLRPLTVHQLDPDWVSTGAIAARIKADYQDIPNWPNLKIFEVAPTGDNQWVATIGNEQNVLYRVVGTGTLRDPVVQAGSPKPSASGSNATNSTAVTCLQRADGATIRCGTVADTGGRGPGVDLGPGGSDATVPDDLKALTPQQLADLQQRVTEEVRRRLVPNPESAAPKG